MTMSQVSFCHSPLFMHPKGTKTRTDMISLLLLKKNSLKGLTPPLGDDSKPLFIAICLAS